MRDLSFDDGTGGGANGNIRSKPYLMLRGLCSVDQEKRRKRLKPRRQGGGSNRISLNNTPFARPPPVQA